MHVFVPLLELLALIAVIVGTVLAIKRDEWKSGTFWLIVSLVLLLVIPLLPHLEIVR